MLKFLRQLLCWHEYEWNFIAETGKGNTYIRCDCCKCGKRIVLAPVDRGGDA